MVFGIFPPVFVFFLLRIRDPLRKISPDELLADFAGVHFRADVALERAKLEDGLLGFMQQMLGTVWHNPTLHAF